jgi:hypothetical protein
VSSTDYVSIRRHGAVLVRTLAQTRTKHTKRASSVARRNDGEQPILGRWSLVLRMVLTPWADGRGSVLSLWKYDALYLKCWNSQASRCDALVSGFGSRGEA